MDQEPKQKVVKGGMIRALGVGFLARQAQCQAILDPLEMMVGWTRLTMTRRTLGTMAGGKGNIRIGELRGMATKGGQTGVTNLGIPRNTSHRKAGTHLLKCSYQSS